MVAPCSRAVFGLPGLLRDVYRFSALYLFRRLRGVVPLDLMREERPGLKHLHLLHQPQGLCPVKIARRGLYDLILACAGYVL